ncbi:MAG TPA: nitroreductase family protein [Terriglobales bacterium]|jgi:nitroreductase
MMPTSASERLLSEAIAERRSTPNFGNQPVLEEDLRKIVRAGLDAPSGYNLQPWRVVVVRDPQQRRALREAAFDQAKVEQAPVVIVACGDPQAWRDDIDHMLRMGEERGFSSQASPSARKRIVAALESLDNMEAWINRQVMIALTSMMLMAEVLGYDTALLEGFDLARTREVLQIPEHVLVVCMMAIGLREGEDKPHGGRFPEERTVFYDRWPK